LQGGSTNGESAVRVMLLASSRSMSFRELTKSIAAEAAPTKSGKAIETRATDSDFCRRVFRPDASETNCQKHQDCGAFELVIC
jgi:hypothetical protein